MQTFKVSIQGVAPLRFNRFTEDSKRRLITREANIQSKEKYENEWKEKLYEDEQGVYVPAKWIKASIVRAAALKKIGRKSAWAWVQSVVFVQPQKIYLPEKTDIKVHEDIVRRPPLKGTVQLARWPIVYQWKIDFNVLLTDELFPADILQEILHLAGLRQGIGDGRPDFGRFEVLAFGQNGKE